MSSFPTFTSPNGLTVTIEAGTEFADFLEGMGRRAARAELLPIMKAHMEPVVASEKSFLGSHSKSGALEGSLKARAGGGDRPGTISVFSIPTATRRQLIRKWGRGRRQQRMWAAGIEPKGGRKQVFYAPFVEKGHRIVKRNEQGELYDTGDTAESVPFASQAAGILESQADLAAEAVLKHITGEQ